MKVLSWLEEDKDMEELRAFGDTLRDKIGSGVVCSAPPRTEKCRSYAWLRKIWWTE